jgi:hypothetical protein
MIDLKKITEDKAQFSYAVAFLCIGIFSFFLLFKIDVGNFIKLENTISQTGQNLTILAGTTEYIIYQDQFNQRLAEQKGANWLIDVLSSLSEKEDIALGVIKPLPMQNISGYNILRVTTDGKASYESLQRLIKALEAYKSYIIVERLSASAAGAELLAPGRDFINMPHVTRQGSMAAAPYTAQANAENTKFTLTIASISRTI